MSDETCADLEEATFTDQKQHVWSAMRADLSLFQQDAPGKGSACDETIETLSKVREERASTGTHHASKVPAGVQKVHVRRREGREK